MSEAEKQRLRQHILQSKASNIVMIGPAGLADTTRRQFQRFEPQNIDRLRLIESQILAGKVPLSEQLKKDQKKKKKKAKKGKQLRGDLARNLREKRRSESGERRDNDAEEPRIVGDPIPPVPGAPQDINVNIPGLAAALARLGLPPPAAAAAAAGPPAAAAAAAGALARRDRPGLPGRADADPIPEIV